MAGGKLTPRQKMINMMYLVLTAMLALNVSKDILKALQEIDDSMVATVNNVEKGNELLYSVLESEAAEKDKAKEWNQRAQALRPQAQQAYDLIETVKDSLISKSGGRDEDGSLKGADNRDVPAGILINGPETGGQAKAKEIREKLEAYKDFLLQNIDDATLQTEIEEMFNFEAIKADGEDTPRQWEERKFAELPLAGIIPFLTDLQAKVRRAESDALEYFSRSIDAKSIKVTDVKAIVMPKSTFVAQGDEYEAQVFLAAYDDTQNPEFTLNGEAIPAENINSGIATIKIPASGIGVTEFSGEILLPGSDSAEVFTGAFTVAPPTAVISPTAMNVLYRQVKNPLEISVPGVQPSQLVVSGPGLSGSNGNYVADITRVSGTEVTISVGVKEEDGSTRSVGSKKFRIKGLPRAEAQIYRTSDSGPYSASAINNAEIQAAYPNFAFDLSLQVTAFELIVPGQPPFRISGNKMTQAARQAISSARPGSTIIVRNVEAKITSNGQSVLNVSPLTLDLN